MNKVVYPLIGLLIIGGIIAVVFSQRSSSSQTMEKDTMMKENSMTPKDTMKEDSMMDSSMEKPGSYVPYTPQSYADAAGEKRVLFFHAPWCPTCKVANEQFSAKPDQIPAGVVLLKTDYDKETELKKKYGITYQHTFVQIDDQGNEITKWSGGDIEALKDNLL